MWRGQFAPFGAELDTLPTANHYKFTGKERDAESGLDYFGARYYESGMGRWMSPDWSAKEDPVPYANFDDPQSLNQYSYVRNNPLGRLDTDGHNFWDFAGGVMNATVTNSVLGLGRKSGNSDFALGQKVGDALSVVGGTIEMAGGAFTAVGGGALTTTGVLAPAGVGAVVLGGALAVHGASEVNTAMYNLKADLKGMKGGSTDGPPGKRVTGAKRQEILDQNGGKCVIEGCDNPAVHVDHATSKANGGSNADANLQGMCASHNCQKGKMNSPEYAKWLKDQGKK